MPSFVGSTHFGEESKALRHYSRGWVWKRAGEKWKWKLWPPVVAGVGHTRPAAEVSGGIYRVSDPMAPEEGFVARVGYPADGGMNAIVTLAMTAAINYMIGRDWAKLWDPLAPLRPLATAAPGDGDMVDITVGLVRLELTRDEAEELAEKLVEVVKGIGNGT
jgi:hypothetical protein